MDLFKAFATNLDQEAQGVTVPYGDATFIVARRGNPAHKAKMNHLMKQHQYTLDRKGAEADRCAEEIVAQAAAAHILLGWTGLTDAEGKELKYSKEAAYTLLTNPQLKDFKEFIYGASDDAARYKAFKEEEDVKN